MAIRGTKRQSGAVRTSVGDASKERSAKQRCTAVAKACRAGAGSHPGKLLAGMAESALLTFKEERHEYQVEVIKSINEVLVAKQEAMKNALAEQAKSIESPDVERTKREHEAKEAAAKVESLTAEKAAKVAELKSQAAATQECAEKAKTAKQAAKVWIKGKVAIESEKAEIDVASQLAGTACGAAALAKVIKLAKKLKCDKAMLDALPATLKHSEEERTEFGKSTVTAFKDRIAEKVAELSAALEKDRSIREESEKGAQDAESARAAADEAEKATQKDINSLHNQLAAAKQDLKAAEKKRAHFLADMKLLMDGFDTAKADLAALVGGPVADLTFLEAYTAPPPEEEAPPAEDAVAAEEAAPAQ